MVTRFVLISFVFCLFIQTNVYSQAGSGGDAQSILDDATRSFDSGDFADAATKLRSFLEKFPNTRQSPLAKYLLGIAEYSQGNYEAAAAALKDTDSFPSAVLPSALFHYGASSYFTGKYDEAVKAFKEAAKPPETPVKQGEPNPMEQVRPFALFYLGRALMEQGSKLEKENKKEEAQKAWAEGLQTLSTMTKDYPESPLAPDALMTRATINVFKGSYDDAVQELNDLKAMPGGEVMKEEADYLLGFVLSQKAASLLADFKREEALQMTQKARKTYQILVDSDNLVIANQAAFQMANLDFADQAFDQAIEAYRSIKSKDRLIQSQQDRLDAIRRQIREAGRDTKKVRALEQALKREEQKLNAVQTNPELAKAAIIKIGDTYMQMQQYDLARTIFRHAAKFASEDQKKRLNEQIILSHAAQGNTEIAESISAEILKDNPNDPMAGNVKFLIGNAFLQQERFEEAIKAFDESMSKFPGGPTAAQAVQLKSKALMGLGRKDEAIKSFRDFIADTESGKLKVDPIVVEDTRRLLALALHGDGKTDEALQILSKLAAEAKTAAIKEEAAFLEASLTAQKGDIEKAISLFRDYSKNFSDSEKAPEAAFQAADLTQKTGDLEKARLEYRAVIQAFPEHRMALFSYDRLWRTHKNDFEKMVEVQNELIKAHPNSDRSLAALFDRAKTLEKMNELQRADETYLQVVEKARAIPAAEQSNQTRQFESFGLLSSALVKQKEAKALGRYPELDDAGKQKHTAFLQSTESLLNQVIREFPGTKVFVPALNQLRKLYLNQLANKQKSLNEAVTALSQLAGQMSDEAHRTKVLITQAGMLNEAGQRSQALAMYDDAFKGVQDTKSVNWIDLEAYGSLLLEDKKYEAALEIYKKLDSITEEKQQRAKAAATYGQGAALQGMGKSAEAIPFFKTLREKFPWSPKLMEAQYATSAALFESGKLAEAVEGLKEVIQSSRSSNESKARSMILLARSYEAMGDKKMTTPDTKLEDGSDMDIYDLAVNNLIKVEVFYAEALPVHSSEALYRAVAIRKKQGKTEDANRMLERLLSTYLTTEWAQKARTDF